MSFSYWDNPVLNASYNKEKRQIPTRKKDPPQQGFSPKIEQDSVTENKEQNNIPRGLGIPHDEILGQIMKAGSGI